MAEINGTLPFHQYVFFYKFITFSSHACLHMETCTIMCVCVRACVRVCVCVCVLVRILGSFKIEELSNNNFSHFSYQKSTLKKSELFSQFILLNNIIKAILDNCFCFCNYL